ncbi:hypothetical protein LOK49_LG06G02289 [Camellia lanceoleosa]|uniref:Uncharacterized protein n=1 Tax=Camellia lanceoleosa TaxID=1840588 RepID=A0ACC0HHU8_9ERIC|nr:hypothetical protein LOK49_LG06G02289 [Camellia lanceoleosa]
MVNSQCVITHKPKLSEHKCYPPPPPTPTMAAPKTSSRASLETQSTIAGGATQTGPTTEVYLNEDIEELVFPIRKQCSMIKTILDPSNDNLRSEVLKMLEGVSKLELPNRHLKLRSNQYNLLAA